MSEDPRLSALRGALAARPPGHHGDIDGLGAREASVLVPLFTAGGDLHVLLTRRADSLGQHAGQIAFPGGGRERGEDELACALREAQEEIALAPAEVEPVGLLDRYTTVSSYLVSPVVGLLRRWPLPLRPEPSEVAGILPVPFDALLARGALRVAERPGTGRIVNFFEVGDEVIWGATAAMLRQLVELATGRPLEPEGDVPWDKVRW